MSVASRRRNIFTTASSSSGGSGTVQSVNSGTDITIDNTDPANPIVNFTGTYQDPITVVANYSALPPVATVTGEFYWCSASQGTAWLPGTLGGTFYNSGLYYSNGVSWEFLNVPYNATQAEVNTGTNTDKFVTPATLTGWNGSTNITKVGTVTTGTLSTGAILGGVTVTVGSDATGDVYYRSAGGIFTRLGIGSSGQVLTVSGGLPSWATASGGGITVGTTTITSGTSGRIAFNNAGVYGENSNLFWDNTNSWLGLGTSTPKATIDLTTTGGAVLRSTYTLTSPFGGLWMGWSAGNATLSSVTAGATGGNIALTTTSQGGVLFGAVASSTISEKVGVLGNIVISSTSIVAGAAGYLEFNFSSAFGGNTANIARITGNVESGGGGGFLFQTASSSTGSHSTKATFTRAGQLFLGGTTVPTAWLHLAAGTTTVPQLNLTPGVAPTTPVDGDIYYINTNDRLMFRKNATNSEIVSASAVTTEVVVSDTTLTITYNGTTYKLLAKA